MGEAGQSVLIVHFEQKLACLDLLAEINVDVLDLACGLRMGLKVVRQLDFAVGRNGLYEILIRDLGGADAYFLAGERTNSVNCQDDKEEGCSPNYVVCCAI